MVCHLWPTAQKGLSTAHYLFFWAMGVWINDGPPKLLVSVPKQSWLGALGVSLRLWVHEFCRLAFPHTVDDYPLKNWPVATVSTTITTQNYPLLAMSTYWFNSLLHITPHSNQFHSEVLSTQLGSTSVEWLSLPELDRGGNEQRKVPVRVWPNQ